MVRLHSPQVLHFDKAQCKQKGLSVIWIILGIAALAAGLFLVFNPNSHMSSGNVVKTEPTQVRD